jgi:hypothetical protein
MRQSAQTTKAVAMNLKHRPETSSRRLNIRLAKFSRLNNNASPVAFASA